MNFFSDLPTTPTIEEQRDVELMLLHFLKKYSPQVYSIWRSHPKLEPEDLVLRADNDGSLPVVLEDGDENAEERVRSWTRRQISPEFNSPVPLLRRFHVEYVSRQLGSLSPAAQGLYPSRPWLAYWSLQAADLLGVTSVIFEQTPAEGLVELLMSCLVVSDCPNYVTEYKVAASSASVKKEDLSESPTEVPEACGVEKGVKPVVGFAGGPSHQMAHVISAYAAVAALALLHSFHPCLHKLPRGAIKRWLLSLRTAEGGFCVHPGGESDIRASYSAAVITTLLRLDDPTTFPEGVTGELDAQHELNHRFNDCASAYARLGISTENGFDLSGYDDIRHTPVLNENAARYVAQKQTYEGGFTCDKYASEAHSAYTQTGLASLLMMKQPQMAHQPRLRHWLAARQLTFEGGFNGRTNKLVDSCYSHWVGSSHIMLEGMDSYARLLGCDLRTRSRRHEREESANGNASSGSDGGQGGSDADRQRGEDGGEKNYFLAKELFLLDHMQLLDISMASCEDNDKWDRAETEEMQKNDLLQRFLTADDVPRREAMSCQGIRFELFTKLHEQECLEGKSLPWTEENITKELRRMRDDAVFAYSPAGDYSYNQRKLQQYVLRCCQCWQEGEGGLMDKPQCNNDVYHTCYSLSGLSGAQNLQYLTHASNPKGSSYIKRAMEEKQYVPGKKEAYGVVVGVEGPSVGAEVSVLRSTNPLINLHRSRIMNAMSVWGVKTFL